MADIKWIKITTDMFDNRKIKHLRRLPDGNNIVLIWVMLLTMAGRCNANGMIFLTENIPYTPKMLADELDFEENTVKLALQVLEDLGMILTKDGFFTIAGWEEYQNIEGMEKMREQNRIRKQRQREREYLECHDDVTQCHVTCHDDVTQCHATEKEEEKEIEEEKENKKKEKDKKEKVVFFENSELNAAFYDFIEFRKKIKKPMSDKAIELNANTLIKLASEQMPFSDDKVLDEVKAIKIINQSIEHGWQTFYELKEPKQSTKTDNGFDLIDAWARGEV